jgi:hypothetical protein
MPTFMVCQRKSSSTYCSYTLARAKRVASSSCVNTSHSTDVFLSGPAFWKVTDDQYFHVDKYVGGRTTQEDISFNAMEQIGNYDTVFPLHESCLEISRRAIDHLKPAVTDSSELSSLAVLNKMLQSRYRDNAKRGKANDRVARNDLLGLCTGSDMDGPRSVVGLSLLEWWAGDYEVSSNLLPLL